MLHVFCFLFLLLSCHWTACSAVSVDCEGDCSVCPEGDCSQVVTLPTRECSQDHSLPLDATNSNVPRQFCGHANSCPQGTQWEAQLNYTFRYRDEREVYLELEWNLDPSIGPYTLIITPSRYDNTVICKEGVAAELLMQSTFRHKVPYYKGDTSHQNVTVMLVPAGQCGGPNITIRAPRDCYSLCPGMCSCREDLPSRGPLLTSPSNLCLNDTTSAVSLSWEPRETYQVPNPAMTFILELFLPEEVVPVATVHVVGKTDVILYLHGESAQESFTLEIKELQCAWPPTITTDAGIPPCSLLPDTTATTLEAAATTSEVTTSAVTTSAAITSATTTSATTTSAATTSAATTSEVTTLQGVANTSTSAVNTTRPSLTSTKIITVTYITPVIIILALITLILVAILIVKIRHNYQLRVPSSEDCEKPEPKELEAKVLVLFSPASSKYECECIMENVVKELAKYSIHSVFFDTSTRESIAEWVATNIETCRKIFLVCNKQFAKEWAEPTGDYLRGNSVVYVLRQVVDSYVKEDRRKLEKFAILYLRKKDHKCLDYPYTRNMKCFLVNPQEQAHLQQIVRFILDKPTYTLP